MRSFVVLSRRYQAIAIASTKRGGNDDLSSLVYYLIIIRIIGTIDIMMPTSINCIVQLGIAITSTIIKEQLSMGITSANRTYSIYHIIIHLIRLTISIIIA
jgi:hypothetical protein